MNSQRFLELALNHKLTTYSSRSSLQTRIAATVNIFIVRADEKLTVFVELESVIRGSCGFSSTRIRRTSLVYSLS
jgi:hypothetical protein